MLKKSDKKSRDPQMSGGKKTKVNQGFNKFQ